MEDCKIFESFNLAVTWENFPYCTADEVEEICQHLSEEDKNKIRTIYYNRPNRLGAHKGKLIFNTENSSGTVV